MQTALTTTTPEPPALRASVVHAGDRSVAIAASEEQMRALCEQLTETVEGIEIALKLLTEMGAQETRSVAGQMFIQVNMGGGYIRAVRDCLRAAYRARNSAARQEGV